MPNKKARISAGLDILGDLFLYVFLVKTVSLGFFTARFLYY